MPASTPASAPGGQSTVRAIAAAVAGTVFEWFDFFLYGSLAVVFGRLFFPPGHETAGLLAALAVFGAGWVVRPLGALVFGRIGDRVADHARQPLLVALGHQFGAHAQQAPVLDHAGRTGAQRRIHDQNSHRGLPIAAVRPRPAPRPRASPPDAGPGR